MTDENYETEPFPEERESVDESLKKLESRQPEIKRGPKNMRVSVPATPERLEILARAREKALEVRRAKAAASGKGVQREAAAKKAEENKQVAKAAEEKRINDLVEKRLGEMNLSKIEDLVEAKLAGMKKSKKKKVIVEESEDEESEEEVIVRKKKPTKKSTLAPKEDPPPDPPAPPPEYDYVPPPPPPSRRVQPNFNDMLHQNMMSNRRGPFSFRGY